MKPYAIMVYDKQYGGHMYFCRLCDGGAITCSSPENKTYWTEVEAKEDLDLWRDSDKDFDKKYSEVVIRRMTEQHSCKLVFA